MRTALRPYASTGVALLSVGMIAASPVVAPPAPSALTEFPAELMALSEVVGWDDVLSNTVGSLSSLAGGIVDLVQGDATLTAGPFELLLSPVGTLLGVADAIGKIPDMFPAILLADNPLAALEGIVNLPAGTVDAFLNGTAAEVLENTVDLPGILGPEGLLDGLVIGVPNTIINLVAGDFPALGFDSLGEMFAGLPDLPAALLDLPLSLLDGLPGFDWLSSIFSALLGLLAF